MRDAVARRGLSHIEIRLVTTRSKEMIGTIGYVLYDNRFSSL